MLEIDKTGTRSFHPQCNSTIERRDWNFLKMFANFGGSEHVICSSFVLFVLGALRSCVHESTALTTHFHVFGHDMKLSLDLM